MILLPTHSMISAAFCRMVKGSMIQTGTLSRDVTSAPMYCWNCLVPQACLRSCGCKCRWYRSDHDSSTQWRCRRRALLQDSRAQGSVELASIAVFSE